MSFAPPFAKYIDLDQIFMNEDIFVYYDSFSVRRMSISIKKVIRYKIYKEANQ